jgi:hypothetical protein
VQQVLRAHRSPRLIRGNARIARGENAGEKVLGGLFPPGFALRVALLGLGTRRLALSAQRLPGNPGTAADQRQQQRGSQCTGGAIALHELGQLQQAADAPRRNRLAAQIVGQVVGKRFGRSVAIR